MTKQLDSLLVKNFKCFNELKIPFSLLTILSGYNGAGKSTSIQPILLLAQAARRKLTRSDGTLESLPLNGDIIRLGTAGDVIAAQATENLTTISVSFGSEVFTTIATAKSNQRSLFATASKVDLNWSMIIERLSCLSYLSAVRAGTEESFPVPDHVKNLVPDVGVDGRFASYWYNELADSEVEESRRCPDETAITFRKQLDAWLSRLAPGASANVQAIPIASALALQFRISDIGEWQKPANVGYGLTYAFPILVSLLAAKKGDIVVVDSPEAHLHPRAQSLMGQMLATFAAAGIQLIIETHSDHILNGARLAVRNKLLSAKDLSLLFFSGVSETSHGVSSPKIDDHGKIDNWPDGFFDQSDKDLAQLTDWS